jgi:hypothetical protein
VTGSAVRATTHLYLRCIAPRPLPEGAVRNRDEGACEPKTRVHEERFLPGQTHVLDTLVDTGHTTIELAVQLDVQPHVVDRIGIA